MKMCPHLQSIHKTQNHKNRRKLIQVLIKKVFLLTRTSTLSRSDKKGHVIIQGSGTSVCGGRDQQIMPQEHRVLILPFSLVFNSSGNCLKI